jgi:hypothetical protein
MAIDSAFRGVGSRELGSDPDLEEAGGWNMAPCARRAELVPLRMLLLLLLLRLEPCELVGEGARAGGACRGDASMSELLSTPTELLRTGLGSTVFGFANSEEPAGLGGSGGPVLLGRSERNEP